MLTIKKMSIFDDPEVEVIIHQANCMCTMKSGIAKVISEKYPEAVESDNMTKRGDKRKLGDFSCAMGKDGKTIVNVYGQYGYDRVGCATDYNALRSGLELAISYFSDKKIGIPYRIGCGLAGGDWIIVSKIIQEVSDLNPDTSITIYKIK